MPLTACLGVRAYLEVVSPPQVSKVGEIAGAIRRWENQVTGLGSRYEQKVDEKLKVAVLLGMLPQEFHCPTWVFGSSNFRATKFGRDLFDMNLGGGAQGLGADQSCVCNRYNPQSRSEPVEGFTPSQGVSFGDLGLQL